jgi:hypothetical protein
MAIGAVQKGGTLQITTEGKKNKTKGKPTNSKKKKEGRCCFLPPSSSLSLFLGN